MSNTEDMDWLNNLLRSHASLPVKCSEPTGYTYTEFGLSELEQAVTAKITEMLEQAHAMYPDKEEYFAKPTVDKMIEQAVKALIDNLISQLPKTLPNLRKMFDDGKIDYNRYNSELMYNEAVDQCRDMLLKARETKNDPHL